MASRSLAPVVTELTAALAAADREEPGALADLRRGRNPIRFESTSHWFAAWDSVQGMLRDLRYMLLPALRLLRDPTFPRDSVSATIAAFVVPTARFLEQFGFREIGAWARAIAEADLADPQYDAALVGLTRYVNRLQSWAFHFFPWDIADRAGLELPAQVAPPAAPVKGSAVSLAPSQDFIRVSFPGLGKSVRAWVASAANPELVADFAAALPFTTFISHASVAGASMFCWSPVVSTAPLQTTERICDAPAGRIRFSQSTGQKFTIQYGETYETVSVAVLGAVVDEDLGPLRDIGAAVRWATVKTKELVWMTVAAD